ncbi:MAG: hypothetical protein AAFQ37_11590, partial [Bacteroidota bacterium]
MAIWERLQLEAINLNRTTTNQYSQHRLNRLDSFDGVEKASPETLYRLLPYLIQSDHSDLRLQPPAAPTLSKLCKRINWDFTHLRTMLQFFSVSLNTQPIPRAMHLPIQHALEKGDEEATEIYRLLLQLEKKQRQAYVRKPKLAKLLRQYEAGLRPAPPTVASWEDIRNSGFPLGFEDLHFYNGKHWQKSITKVFQLLNAVVDFPITKLYTDHNRHNLVRYQFQGVPGEFQVAPRNLFDSLQPLNQLLFQLNIPYQFTAFSADQKPWLEDNYSRAIHQKSIRVTLCNQATRDEIGVGFATSLFVDFALTEEPPVSFLANIDELPPLQLSKELDRADIRLDDKFSTLHQAIQPLKQPEDWIALLNHCLGYPNDGKPNKSWQKKATTFIKGFSPPELKEGMAIILTICLQNKDWWQDTEQLAILRGLTWLARLNNQQLQLQHLKSIARKAYQKVPGGPRNAKLGNIALESLASIATIEAYGMMNDLLAKTKYTVFQR